MGKGQGRQGSQGGILYRRGVGAGVFRHIERRRDISRLYDFRLPTFDFRLSTSNFRLSTFDFRLLIVVSYLAVMDGS
jgi:hypothetical protein